MSKHSMKVCRAPSVVQSGPAALHSSCSVPPLWGRSACHVSLLTSVPLCACRLRRPPSTLGTRKMLQLWSAQPRAAW